ncbi:MAG: hypothetical protein ACP5DC_11310 [Halothiobacillaceae bacterium]
MRLWPISLRWSFARQLSAMADLRRYRDLVVRVAGLNARFVELSPAEQQELIDRAEQAASTARPGVSA